MLVPAGATCFGVILTSLLAMAAQGSSWGPSSWPGTSTGHDGGRGCIFFVGVRSNTICLGMGTASSGTEIPQFGKETDLLQVRDS